MLEWKIVIKALQHLDLFINLKFFFFLLTIEEHI